VAYLQSTSGLQFAGVMSYAGASYQLQQGALKAALFARHAQAMSDFCAGCGAGSAIRSIGSTPAFMHARAAQGVTEVRCGIHVFQDLFQAGMGHCRVTDIALSVLTRVISVDAARGRLFVDAGALALSKDRSTAGRDFDAGYGSVWDPLSGEPIDDWYVAAVHQEHGIVQSRSGHLLADEVAIDTLLRILPNHADMTAAAFDRYFVTDGDAEVVDCWQRDNGWAPAR
jgi:D-serine deaminase-like pyridoxal phosphate-dependent protein